MVYSLTYLKMRGIFPDSTDSKPEEGQLQALTQLIVNFGEVPLPIFFRRLCGIDTLSAGTPSFSNNPYHGPFRVSRLSSTHYPPLSISLGCL